MSTEGNKEVLRRIVEVWNTGNLGPLEDLIAPDYVVDFSGSPIRPESGPEWYRQFVGNARIAYPDFHVAVHDQLANGDKVTLRWTVTGTHRGDWVTPWGFTVPRTGKQVSWTGITIHRLVNGKIAEDWWELDRLGLMQQLGAIPSSEQATA